MCAGVSRYYSKVSPFFKTVCYIPYIKIYLKKSDFMYQYVGNAQIQLKAATKIQF